MFRGIAASLFMAGRPGERYAPDLFYYDRLYCIVCRPGGAESNDVDHGIKCTLVDAFGTGYRDFVERNPPFFGEGGFRFVVYKKNMYAVYLGLSLKLT